MAIALFDLDHPLSHNDLPLLEAVGHPVAVDPDEALARRAGERGWPVISLAGNAP